MFMTKQVVPFRTITSVKKLHLIANTIRQDIIHSLVAAGSGHSGGPLGMADVFTALYFAVLTHNPKKPWWPQRDYVILSCGHICPVWYATLAHAGYFPRKELLTLRHIGSRLQGHPHKHSVPGIETPGGPLGEGLSVACGLAYGLRMDKKKNRVFCVMSDGEQEEGNVWEAVMFAGKYKLHNLTCFIDRNNMQIDGHTEDIMPLEPLRDKYESFNWHVLEVDGHNMQAVMNACHEAAAIYEKPTVIICHTIPGKGVSFMENDYTWHGKPPTHEQAVVALHELRHWRQEIER